MVTTTKELNSIGVVQHYGARQINDGLPADVSTMGVVKQMVMSFDYDDLALGKFTAAQDAANLLIPANSMIRHAFLEVDTAWVGGTSINIGLDNAAGTEIDADGLFTAAAAITANLTAKAWLVGTGALAANKTVGTAAAALTVDVTGTFTAGAARLIVEYIEPSKAN